eukprot:TRINITY_DN2073_c0_g1_i5.p1 TRINITY_DN2073_c0_g1~~TRINITY_DN2073_c0_g1_i5.p1  ORF type:complete len:290 (+),score=-25.64 TRINITY_DN2073_c0_g1_i5:220-1089(+)
MLKQKLQETQKRLNKFLKSKNTEQINKFLKSKNTVQINTNPNKVYIIASKAQSLHYSYVPSNIMLKQKLQETQKRLNKFLKSKNTEQINTNPKKVYIIASKQQQMTKPRNIHYLQINSIQKNHNTMQIIQFQLDQFMIQIIWTKIQFPFSTTDKILKITFQNNRHQLYVVLKVAVVKIPTIQYRYRYIDSWCVVEIFLRPGWFLLAFHPTQYFLLWIKCRCNFKSLNPNKLGSVKTNISKVYEITTFMIIFNNNQVSKQRMLMQLYVLLLNVIKKSTKVCNELKCNIVY